ncbi:MAG: DUF493 domain-containing protein [Bacteriovoracaceae bacterium]
MSDEKFRSLLDESHQWPEFYEFKFIIKTDDKDLILVHLNGFQISEKPSGKGNYISISARKLMNSPDEIIAVYKLMSGIKGLISL